MQFRFEAAEATDGVSSGVRAFGDAGGPVGGSKGWLREPKGLTRALKIENSKWPIFPADGTETKSRQPFIMTCIAVRAAVICNVSLQNENGAEPFLARVEDIGILRCPSLIYSIYPNERL